MACLLCNGLDVLCLTDHILTVRYLDYCMSGVHLLLVLFVVCCLCFPRLIPLLPGLYSTAAYPFLNTCACNSCSSKYPAASKNTFVSFFENIREAFADFLQTMLKRAAALQITASGQCWHLLKTAHPNTQRHTIAASAGFGTLLVCFVFSSGFSQSPEEQSTSKSKKTPKWKVFSPSRVFQGTAILQLNVS